jgi:flagellar protein FlaG
MDTNISAVTASGAVVSVPGNDSSAAAQSTSKTEQQVVSQPAEKTKVSNEQLSKMVQELNDKMQSLDTSLSFSVDQETKRVVIKVIDDATKEVVRQIPAEQMLEVSHHISEVLGMLVDEEA